MKNKFYNMIGENRGINKLVDIIDDKKGLFECLICHRQKELVLKSWLYSNTKKCKCEFKNTSHYLNGRYGKMIDRCYNKKSHNYKYYGGRGITVCDRWLESFDNFLEDMEESFQEGLQLDRIDNDGPYSPENCKWVSHSENMQNRKSLKIKTAILTFILFLVESLKEDFKETKFIIRLIYMIQLKKLTKNYKKLNRAYS